LYNVGTPASATITIGDSVPTVVTVTAVDATASEVGPNPGTFRFARTGSTAAPLSVSFNVSGTATNNGGSDFTPFLNGGVTFNAGQATVDATITPVLESTIEGD